MSKRMNNTLEELNKEKQDFLDSISPNMFDIKKYNKIEG